MLRDDKSRVIGKITNVSAGSLIVELHGGSDNFTVVGFDDMHYIATLGSYLMVPVHANYVVLEVVGLSEKDNAPYVANQGELDKVSSVKFLKTTPVGTIDLREKKFQFGVSTYPPLYADVMYARDKDLDCIFDVVSHTSSSDSTSNANLLRPQALEIGTSSIFGGYPVKVTIDEFFGGHIAVLGNTGSGKSCTIASIIQSIFTESEPYSAYGSSIIVFDINGEYRRTLGKIPTEIRSLYLESSSNEGLASGTLAATAVPPAAPAAPAAPAVPCVSSIQDAEDAANSDKSHSSSKSERDGEECSRFTLPHWFMNFEEWELLLRASEKSQIPVLRTALGLAGLFHKPSGQKDSNNIEKIREHIFSKILLSVIRGSDTTPTKVDRILTIYHNVKRDNFSVNYDEIIEAVKTSYGELADKEKIEEVMNKLEQSVKKDIALPSYDHSQFSFTDLQQALDLAIFYEESNGNKQIRDYCSSLVTRLKSITEHQDYKFLRPDPNAAKDHERNLNSYVEYILGISAIEERSSVYRKDRQICILDLNDAPDEVIQLSSAVVSRLVFDRLRRAEHRSCLPVHLILEEAHRYISEKPSKYAIDASDIFTRISKEGRKYGLFLLVASQRPSELSKTVLSQCSNFVIHRIQNPDDLFQIRQMTPFISDSVLDRLASLPKQHALIFGNSVNIPMTFRVRTADPEPYSNDARIREIWYADSGQDVPLGK